MIKKILKITGKMLVGLYCFYLFLALVVVPLAGKWAVNSQATKLLRHPVKVRSILFNPFLWRLNVNGLEIRDDQDELMAGFDHFSVNVSALALFKKIYRVEAVVLDGLDVRAALLPDGTINLLELVPSSPEDAAPDVPPEPEEEGEAPAEAGPAEFPPAVIDLISVKNGTVRFEDQSIDPTFKTVLSRINIEISGLSTDPASQAKVVFSAQLDDRGEMKCETLISPFQQPPQVEASFELSDYILRVLTPYTGKYTGRAVGEGKLDLKLDYRISDNQISAGHNLLIQRFDFGEKVQSEDALKLPFGLVVGLLEDPQGRIKISLPVTGNMNDPEFKYMQVLGQVVKNFFIKIATKPFSFLASMIGAESGTEDLGYVRFAPGSAELSAEERDKLSVLVNGLKERPRLTLEINGSYDPDADWEQIRTQVFLTDYETLREESQKLEVEVMHQLYQRRFGLRALWALVKESRLEHGDDHEKKLEQEIRRQLIEHAPADKLALDMLAQTRAQIVYDAILAAGFDKSRLSLGANREVQSTLGNVPLEFTLTVFSQEGQPQEESLLSGVDE